MPSGPTSIFEPATLGPIRLRNRVIKTATYEGMCPEGVPSVALVQHHRQLAAGGVGMTTVAYCAVSTEGRTFGEQMYMRDGIVPALRRVTDAVHAEGARVSVQLGHCGAFSRHREPGTRAPLGPSTALNSYGLMAGLPLARGMDEADIARTADDFGRAAAWAVEAGFDAVELHLGHATC